MYRSDQSAALARAHAAWDDLVDAHHARGTQPTASEPDDTLTTDELVRLVQSYEIELHGLPPIVRSKPPPKPAGAPNALEAARDRFGKALSDWFSLSREVRAHEKELLADARAQRQPFDAAKIIGTKPKREGAASVASYEAMASQLEAHNATMRGALARLEAPALTVVAAPPVKEIVVQNRELRFRNNQAGWPVLVMVVPIALFIAQQHLPAVAAWVATAAIFLYRQLPTIRVSQRNTGLEIARGSTTRLLEYDELTDVAIYREATVRIATRTHGVFILQYAEASEEGQALFYAWVAALNEKVRRPALPPAA